MFDIKFDFKLFRCKVTGRTVTVHRNGLITTSKGAIISLNKDGYRIFGLKGNGIQKGYRATRIVAELFVENTENKPCVNHKNGIKTDDRVENLEWVIHSENTIHAFETGLMKHPLKLSREKIEEIKRECKDNSTAKLYSIKFNVCVSHIKSIAKLKNQSSGKAQRKKHTAERKSGVLDDCGYLYIKFKRK